MKIQDLLGGKSLISEDDSSSPIVLRDKEDFLARKKALQQIAMDPDTNKDSMLKAELVRKVAQLRKAAIEKGFIKDQQQGV